MAQLAAAGAVSALESAEELYREVLIVELARQARAGGDAVLKRVLLRYYATAQRELAACGYSDVLARLVSDQDWVEAVAPVGMLASTTFSPRARPSSTWA